MSHNNTSLALMQLACQPAFLRATAVPGALGRFAEVYASSGGKEQWLAAEFCARWEFFPSTYSGWSFGATGEPGHFSERTRTRRPLSDHDVSRGRLWLLV